MNEEQITTELSDCKTTDRHVTDVQGNRFWVFGLRTGGLLVRRVVDGIRKPLRTMEYNEVATIEPVVSDDFAIEPESITVTINAVFKVAREIPGGFAKYISIKWTDYGSETPEEDRFYVSVRLRGHGKTPTGKLDKRSSGNGLIVCFDSGEYQLAKEVLTKAGSANAIRIIPFVEKRIR